MAALRKLQPSPSSSKTQQYMPLKGILKRRRSPTPSDGGDEVSEGEDAWPRSKRASCHPPATHLLASSSSPVKLMQRPSSKINNKRRALMQESSVEDAAARSISTIKRHAHAHSLQSPSACKFAKAGCPFTGSHDEVKHHELSYCAPIYQQLAHFKMLAARNSVAHTSPHASTSKLPYTSLDDRSASVSNSNGMRVSSVALSPSSASVSLEEITSETEALHAQIRGLQADLQRAQSQLAEEKKQRTERLRKASEKCLELMSLSEIGENKVEVLRMKLKAERELREKLEEELESVGAANTAGRRP